jgi:hypothetical protein
MRGKERILATLFGAFLAAGIVAAQEAAHKVPPPGPMPQSDMRQGPMMGPLAERIEILGLGGWHGGKVVTGAPFSAVAVTEMDQTLADGNKIIRKTQANLYRDTQGRFRREITLPAIGPLAAQGQPRSFIVIQDPVAGASYVLDPDRKTARQLPGRARNDRGAKDQLRYRPEAVSDFQKESLGTRTISGISAEGTRYTRTIPAGQIGNEKPITIVRETWYSPALQMMVMIKRSDPRFGDTTYTLTNIQRSEPPANLFTVPTDYTLKQGRPRRAMRFMRKGQMPPQPPPSDAPGPDL